MTPRRTIAAAAAALLLSACGDDAKLVEAPNVEVRPAEVAKLQPFEARSAASPNTVLFLRDADSFERDLGAPPPTSLDFERETVVLVHVSDAPALSTELRLDVLVRDDDTLDLTVVSVLPGSECSTLPPRGALGVFRIQRTDGQPIRQDTFGASFASQRVPCDTGDRPGISEVCAPGQPCAAGLLCAGLSAAETGICVDASRLVDAEAQWPLPVPAGDVLQRSEDVSVEGVVADALVRVDLAATGSQSFELSLRRPSGAETTLVDDTNGQRAFLFNATEVHGTPMQGEWQLLVRERSGALAGELEGWGLVLVGRDASRP